MKYRLIALFACSPLTACIGVSPYAAPISNPLADINAQAAGIPLVPVRHTPRQPAYTPPAARHTVMVRPISEYAPEALPLPEALPAQHAAAADNRALPYPAIDPHTQIRQLTQENIHLRQHIDFLNKRIVQLEHTRPQAAPHSRPAPVTRKKAPKASIPRPAPVTAAAPPPALPVPAAISHTAMPDPNLAKLKLARQQYRRGDYKGVLQTLRGADSGGDGSTHARHSMYLLLQANHRLNYCQSVIQIGQRLASRYANSPEAPEALYTVGECQRGIQQQDIARDTWRKLISSYPDSTAARRARANLKNL